MALPYLKNRNVANFEGVRCSCHVPFGHRDYYKVTLCKNEATITYAEKIVHINKPAVIFTEPGTPYAWDSKEPLLESYRCVFNETFAQRNNRALLNFSVFQPGKQKIIFIEEAQLPKLEGYFKDIKDILATNYSFAEEKVFALIQLIIYEVLPKCPEVIDGKSLKKDSLSNRFFKILEDHFSLLDDDTPLLYKTPSDYSNMLAVHPNHLNRVLKKSTGKTTSILISERVIEKANEFLMHSEWNISQISYALGFENTSYFNQFYKKQTGTTPGQSRLKNV
ncbi:helix-turn-helix domain-containing protein [Neptunitalea lumnitzerae]|uniref:Transcriptional regulator n=1 Tax=Neptunitalea lumnitzerae TaxID=2965509 RepID=A0ABQ5MHZ5_9FLAO|nr:helix-turn-helix transcriptional regulator [Neptunitalea sp. Y10]GLB48552.1 transcriptional regulator [Neptunitalea sp. Y10]